VRMVRVTRTVAMVLGGMVSMIARGSEWVGEYLHFTCHP
jgi:hypothetical protein